MASTISTSTARTPRLSRQAEILLKVVMVIGGPLLLIGLLEGVAYIWERGQANGLYAWELVASRRLVWVKHSEPGTGYTLMEPGRHYQWQGISVDINSYGLRGPETTYKKPFGTFRILNLGDSVAMGWGVQEEDTYGRQLESRLNEQVNGNLRYEVINAGVPGWNPTNELAYLRAEGLKYTPDLILLELTIVNDIYGESALVAHERPPLVEWLRDKTYFWPFFTIQLRWIEAFSEGRDRIPVIDPPTEPGSYFPLDPEADRWAEVWSRISAMHQLAVENEVPFVLVLVPMEYQVVDENYSTLPQEVFITKATETGIPVLDPLLSFQQACREKNNGPCYVEDRYLFADVWMHPSAYGNELIAIELETLLKGSWNRSGLEDETLGK